MTQSTTFQLFDFLVYTVWACLKAMTQLKTLKEKSTNKNYNNDNYNLYSDTIYYISIYQYFNAYRINLKWEMDFTIVV